MLPTSAAPAGSRLQLDRPAHQEQGRGIILQLYGSGLDLGRGGGIRPYLAAFKALQDQVEAVYARCDRNEPSGQDELDLFYI